MTIHQKVVCRDGKVRSFHRSSRSRLHAGYVYVNGRRLYGHVNDSVWENVPALGYRFSYHPFVLNTQGAHQALIPERVTGGVIEAQPA